MQELPKDLQMDNFESVLAGIDVGDMDVGDMDVIDEVGGDDSADEENKSEDRNKSRREEKDKRSRTRSIGSNRERSYSSRNRSRSPRRYNRSRSRERRRSRSPIRHRSPIRNRNMPMRKGSGGGAADFLKEMHEQFGEFEGLKEVEKKVISHSIMDEKDKLRSPRRNNRNNNRNQNQQQNQYQNMNNGGMPTNQMNMMMMNPMYNQQIMGMMGTMMPQMNQMPFPAPYNDGTCPPGVDPTAMGFQPQPFMPQPVPMIPDNCMTQVNPEAFRNASPPPAANIDLGVVKSRLLMQNEMNLSDFLETQASTSSKRIPKTIEPRPLKERGKFRSILTKTHEFYFFFLLRNMKFNTKKIAKY